MTAEIERKRNKVDYGPEMRLRTEVEEDRLSSLPDGIIHHILSFIDTKFAVQTCVLSSRWKLIWTFLPHLKLTCRDFRLLPKFSEFVNCFLSRRNNYAEVSTIDLHFRGRIRQKFVGKMVSYAMSHNVQKIQIKFDSRKGDKQFPPCLFSSESLRHLSLSTYFSHYYYTFPCSQSPWNLPALTTLDLKNIWLCYDGLSSLDLFSKCVNLKNLTLADCRARGLGVMKIFCPQLVNLTLKNWWISKFALLTPNLSSFYYEGDSEVSLSTDGLHCLDTVNLKMSMPDPDFVEETQDAHRLISMLQELRNAKNLILHSDFIEFVSTVPDVLEHQPSPFSKLKCLTIKSTNSAMIDKVRNYLINSSSSADVIVELPENGKTTGAA